MTYSDSPTRTIGPPRARLRFTRTGALCLVAGLALAGCATPNATHQTGSHTEGRQTAAVPDDSMDPVAGMAYWSNRYDKTPQDPTTALNYGKYLRYVGRKSEATKVLAEALTHNADNAELMAEYGKALASVGRVDEGLAYLAEAAAKRPKDWEIQSAQGVAYDQLGQHDQADAHYEAALKLSPGNPAVLNNMALSAAQAGDLTSAESLLRQAVEQPSSTPEVRLNLALVLGLKGDFDEARKYAALDLPPEKVEENLSLIKSMVQEPAPWEALKALQ